MRTIRRSVFETNSSSVHTIAIAKSGRINDTLLMDDDGICDVYPGEFGWGYEKYYDAPGKASYCLTAAMNPVNQERLDMLRNVIKEKTGAKEVQFRPFGSEYYDKVDSEAWGYIDHQSVDEASLAFESRESLMAFIFNPGSALIIDNDNH